MALLLSATAVAAGALSRLGLVSASPPPPSKPCAASAGTKGGGEEDDRPAATLAEAAAVSVSPPKEEQTGAADAPPLPQFLNAAEHVGVSGRRYRCCCRWPELQNNTALVH